MIIPILIGLILVLVLSSISFSMYVGAFVSGFLSKGIIKGAISAVVVFGLATFILNYFSTSSITGAFIRTASDPASIYEVLCIAALGSLAGFIAKLLKH